MISGEPLRGAALMRLLITTLRRGGGHKCNGKMQIRADVWVLLTLVERDDNVLHIDLVPVGEGRAVAIAMTPVRPVVTTVAPGRNAVGSRLVRRIAPSMGPLLYTT